MKSLQELATALSLSFRGDANHTLKSVGTLSQATQDQISFLANPKYQKQLTKTQAGVVIVSPAVAETYHGQVLIADDPYVAFAKVAQIFADTGQHATTIHPQTAINDEAVIGEQVGIGAFTVIEAGCEIGSGCQIGHNVTLGQGVRLGKNCIIKSGVTIEAGCQLGDRCTIHPGAIIGADGFGLARDKSGWVKIPQTGVVIMGDDCEVGANTTIDCGAIENTVLGNDVRLDNQIQIGHNVHIGDHTVMAGCTAVAGSTEIGKNCMIGGGVGIVGHIKISDGVVVQAMSLVTHSIKEPGNYSGASPLQKTADWRRTAVRYRQLDQLAKKVNHMTRSEGQKEKKND